MTSITEQTAVYARKLRDYALVIDTETTGTGGEDEVIELAIVKASNGQILYNGRFRPKKSVGFSSRVHHITDAELRKERYWCNEVIEELNLILNGATCAAWNAPFDRRLISQSYSRCGHSEPSINWVCLMKLYSELKGISNNLKLEEVCAELSVKPGDHSAKADALAAARVLYRMAECAAPNEPPADELIISVPASPEIEETDEITITAYQFLVEFGWSERINKDWTDPLSGGIYTFLSAMDKQRARMISRAF